MSFDVFRAQADEIAARCNDRTNKMLRAKRWPEAAKSLTLGQKELRNLKRDIAVAERELRSEFQAERTQLSGKGRFVGLLMPYKFRRIMSAGRGHARKRLAEGQQEAVLPYQRLRAAIDDLIADMDGMKFEIENGDLDDRATDLE